MVGRGLKRLFSLYLVFFIFVIIIRKKSSKFSMRFHDKSKRRGMINCLARNESSHLAETDNNPIHLLRGRETGAIMAFLLRHFFLQAAKSFKTKELSVSLPLSIHHQTLYIQSTVSIHQLRCKTKYWEKNPKYI